MMNLSSAAQRFKTRLILPTLLFSSFCHFSSAAILTISDIGPGDILISELMANPAAVSDTNGEWFEIYNTTNATIDLNGLSLRDNGSNQHTINTANSLLINPGDYFVLGRSGDNTNNGGYSADYVYNNFSLANTTDAIILEVGATTIASLLYDSPLFGTAGNSVEWNNSSFSLTPDTLSYGDGDIGSPGEKGSTDLISAVPIPAAGWLMTTALSSLMIIRRKSQQP